MNTRDSAGPLPAARPHRHPASGGYRSGANTRVRLIETAIEVFGRLGFRGASTRTIAAEAGVNTPALIYYFENKAGLYFACVEHITAEVEANFRPIFEEVEQMLSREASTAELIDVYCGLQETMIDSFGEDHGSGNLRKLEDSDNDLPEVLPARDLVRSRIHLPLYRTVCSIVAKLMGQPADDFRVSLHSISLLGQTTIYYFQSNMVGALIGWDRPDDEQVREIKSALRIQSELLLHQLASHGASMTGAPN